MLLTCKSVRQVAKNDHQQTMTARGLPNVVFCLMTEPAAARRAIFYPVQGCDGRTDGRTKTERGSGAAPPARSRCATPTANLPFPQSVSHSREPWEPLRAATPSPLAQFYIANVLIFP